MLLDSATWPVAAFVTGLAGSLHCIGMCGGLVATFAWQPGGTSPVSFHRARPKPTELLARQFAFNGGRLASYALLGALAGSVAAAGIAMSSWFPLRQALFVAAQVLMILLGLYLAGFNTALGGVERAGAWIWKRIQPFTAPLLPVRSTSQAFVLGTLWGWLPCGMVYTMLLAALSSGSAANGAILMMAFGAGTLPALMLAGAGALRMRQLMAAPVLRTLAGAVVAIMGLVGLARASALSQLPGVAALCHTIGIGGAP